MADVAEADPILDLLLDVEAQVLDVKRITAQLQMVKNKEETHTNTLLQNKNKLLLNIDTLALFLEHLKHIFSFFFRENLYIY